MYVEKDLMPHSAQLVWFAITSERMEMFVDVVAYHLCSIGHV